MYSKPEKDTVANNKQYYKVQTNENSGRSDTAVSHNRSIHDHVPIFASQYLPQLHSCNVYLQCPFTREIKHINEKIGGYGNYWTLSTKN